MGFNVSLTWQGRFHDSDNQVGGFLVNWYASGINLGTNAIGINFGTNAIAQLWPDGTLPLKTFLNRKLRIQLNLYEFLFPLRNTKFLL